MVECSHEILLRCQRNLAQWRALKENASQQLTLALSHIHEDTFTKNMEHYCQIGSPRLETQQYPFPIEEPLPKTASWKGEIDHICLCRMFIRRVDRTTTYYQWMSWLFILMNIHGLTLSNPTASILDRSLFISFQYVDGWGMDHLGLYHCLAFHDHADLGNLAEKCQKIGDIW